MVTSAQDVLRRLGDDGIERIDLKVTDLAGRWQSISLEAHHFGEGAFLHGLALDGLLLHPDPATAWIDPFLSPRSLSLIAAVEGPPDGAGRLRHCPRTLATRALALLAGSGLADAARFGTESGYFLFQELTSRADDLGCGCRVAPGGAIPEALHSELGLTLAALGIRARLPLQRAAGPLQHLTLASDDPLRAADALMVSRYVVRNVARRHGWSATFLPRPSLDATCAGLAVHQSLWRVGHPLFAGEGTYGELSQTARWYLGGLLRHGPSLAAFTNPGTNSYRRLGSGPQAPSRLAYARHDSATVVAIPEPDGDPGRRRLVLRQADGLANPYLAFSAILLAGLDGVRHQIDPGPPADREPAHRPGDQPAALPADLGAALAALAADHDYLLVGDVFSRELLDDWIALKHSDVEALEQRPHPLEFVGEASA
ncbi:glutamine synthetase family protein [Cyanobium gracile]|uniref:glutamine synthetase n=1 Tax=Cyanobium gracile (strain ATCC 27147 / PCC 6307) TaxID=292564 RepID=K9P2P1_CYAGP|nr:glutamine synthetase family protein [Cyanobium gracile]AFY27667.1 glutamine synthetase [Cyanobium gracile PCC 6307]